MFLYVKSVLMGIGLLSLVEITASSPFWHKNIQKRLQLTTKEALQNNIAAVLPLDINVEKGMLHFHRADIHFFPCLFSTNTHYNWVNIGKEQMLFLHRRLLQYAWAKQYWFVGGYWGVAEPFSQKRKIIGGVELAGSRFGQMTVNFFHQRSMLKGLSFKYRFNTLNKVQSAIFFSMPWDLDPSTDLVPSRFGIAGRYAMTKDWSVELEWIPYNVDTSPVFCLRWRYGHDHQIARPALLQSLVQPPDYYMPYFVKPTIVKETVGFEPEDFSGLTEKSLEELHAAQEKFAELTGESNEFIKYASKEELRALYYKASLRYHPDKGGGLSDGKAMKALNAAYEVLKRVTD